VPDTFKDHRGLIEDLLVTPIDSVTRIRTLKGALRGNHVHHHTTQWTYIVSGVLRIATKAGDGPVETRDYFPDEIAVDPPGTAHAWYGVTDSTVLVFTKGPRSGDNYESDTVRLFGADRIMT
jgi:quercetin dioxygenase-like cupin family protein